ncbi:hypothetical protein acsn021_32400 [Anaerocolumna cellulosilytica]|uniref:Uncharacterized protein n=1 Tax=Anaerocolumna cellulosilytica TaxID=433286 RepID=A0A6S6R9Y6_9FIRM|nr:hypothetical protein [Anaerocolumna cellulosilytica]MBB5196570.1 hypothetical protein [Anaerocolumna cellulosilytica]BCJ95671.1 hypothetical protein acsn021_32400 [Anaerocolumna cellulosilytica]
MNTMLKIMRMRKNEIPVDILLLFEDIVRTYKGAECEEKFIKAMEEHLTKEQRFRLYEQNGSCSGTGHDKERKAFAHEHADKPLAERLELFKRTFGRTAVLNDDNTITVTFACKHGYYKHAPKGMFRFPASIETYFERCAGGRLYEYQKALGIRLRIKSVDVSPLSENIVNPVVFTFDIVG